MEGKEEKEDEKERKIKGEDMELVEEAEVEDERGEISFHALKGEPTGKIIKVKGQARRRKLMVLIDSGSTYSFLSEATATDL